MLHDLGKLKTDLEKVAKNFEDLQVGRSNGKGITGLLRKAANVIYELQLQNDHLNKELEEATVWHSEPPKNWGFYEVAHCWLGEISKIDSWSLEILDYVKGSWFDFYGKELDMSDRVIYWRYLSETPKHPGTGTNWYLSVFE